MSFKLIEKVNAAQKKTAVVDVRTGDTVRVSQKIREGNKERIQVFEGTVIRTDRKGSHTSRFTVRKVSSGVGVEKSFLINSPLVDKVEIVRRSKVRRKYLSFLRNRSGKSARLKSQNFDREAANKLPEAANSEVPEAAEPSEESTAE
jgi:large subunit ribosomal protein L19